MFLGITVKGPEILILLASIFSLSFAIKATGFNSPRSFELPVSQSAVAAGDLNRDGIPDLVLGGYPSASESFGRIRVLLGRGNGNFLLHGEYRVGFLTSSIPALYVQNVKIGDLNNDGNLDVVVGHTRGNTQFNNSSLLSTILLGDGLGSLQERESNLFFTDNDFVMGLDLVDFNNDGLLDVLIATRASSLGRIFGLRNVGGGNFQRIGPLTVADPIAMMVCADVNTDGNVDVVVTTSRGIIVRYGDGVFFPTAERIGDESDVGGLVVSDLNSDGKVDIAVTDSFSTRLRVFARRTFRFPLVPITYNIPFISSYMKSSDINEDGIPDLVILGGLPNRFFILYGDGRGRYPTSEILQHGLPVSDIVFADLDSNGRTDIAASLASEAGPNRGAVFLKAPNTTRYFFDFDDDLQSDFTVYRPSNGTWFTRYSGSATFRYQPFGISSDRIVPGNYDGDNKADIGVFRDGVWYVLNTADNSVRIKQFGLSGDVPVPADYDNDGVTNLAVFRPDEGRWYIERPGGFGVAYWGLSTDTPVHADYDGDGKTDIAVWRPSTGVWYVNLSSNGTLFALTFGNEQLGDIPVPSDYDGDGKADIAIWRPSEGNWYLMQSTSGLSIRHWGTAGDLPVSADYDGDGKSDLAVWRPNSGSWFYTRSSDGTFGVVNWGVADDIPIQRR